MLDRSKAFFEHRALGKVREAEFVELSHSGGNTAGGAWVNRVAAAKVLVVGNAHGHTAYRF